MRKIAFLMSILILFILAIPKQSHACDCMISEDPLTEKEMYDGVFSGEVVEIVDKAKNKRIQSSADLLEVRLTIKETWKGVEQTAITLFTERDSASCGFPFEVGEEYLIYANQNGDKWQVNNCSRTALLSDAVEDLAAFGQGEEPTKPPIEEKKSEQAAEKPEVNHTNTIILALMGVIVLGVVIGFAWKK